MGNLVSEYRSRHKLDFVWAATNGVCFFSKRGRPYSVCLVSEPQHAVSQCSECRLQRKDTIIIEFVSFKDKRKIDMSHDHMPPDADLNALVCHAGKFFGDADKEEACQPLMARSNRDIEAWLWSFFLAGTQPFSGVRWQGFRKSQKGGKATKAVEQMMWAALNYPSMYKLYYDQFYRTYLLGRNYLLWR